MTQIEEQLQVLMDKFMEDKYYFNRFKPRLVSDPEDHRSSHMVIEGMKSEDAGIVLLAMMIMRDHGDKLLELRLSPVVQNEGFVGVIAEASAHLGQAMGAAALRPPSTTGSAADL